MRASRCEAQQSGPVSVSLQEYLQRVEAYMAANGVSPSVAIDSEDLTPSGFAFTSDDVLQIMRAGLIDLVNTREHHRRVARPVPDVVERHVMGSSPRPALARVVVSSAAERLRGPLRDIYLSVDIDGRRKPLMDFTIGDWQYNAHLATQQRDAHQRRLECATLAIALLEKHDKQITADLPPKAMRELEDTAREAFVRR